MTKKSSIIGPDKFVEAVRDAAEGFVQPSLIAIYGDRPDQIGTGFLTVWNAKPLLVTAKHVLFGHKFDEDPLKKLVHVGDGLEAIGALKASAIADNQELDLAAVHITGFPVDLCLAYTALRFDEAPPGSMSITGFLARDFRRSKEESTLRPKPYLYTGTTKQLAGGLIGINHERRGRATGTEKVEMAPIPRGLSGTAMVSSTALLRNKVEIFGVFTEQHLDKGYVSGTHIAALQPLLNELLQDG